MCLTNFTEIMPPKLRSKKAKAKKTVPVDQAQLLDNADEDQTVQNELIEDEDRMFLFIFSKIMI